MILGLNLNFKKEKMENGCYVISRDQVNLDLNIVECKNETVAKQLINENRKRYVDSIHLTLNDLLIVGHLRLISLRVIQMMIILT